MEPLDRTPLQAGIRISTWLRQRDFVLRAFVVLAGLSLLGALAATLLALSLLRQRTQFVALTPDHTIVLVEGTAMENARELHQETALQATTALLTRGPKGMDLTELMPRLFSKETQALAEQLRQNEQPEFSERQWQQKPSVRQVDVLEARGSSVEVHVTGQLVRSGPFAGDRHDGVLPFTLRLTLVRNRDLLRSRRYPLLVTAFTLTYETSRP